MCNIQGCKKIWYSESNNWEFVKPSQCKKIGHAKVKQLLVQAKDEELQGRLDRLRKIIDKIDDVDNNNIIIMMIIIIITLIFMIGMIMIVMLVEKN